MSRYCESETFKSRCCLSMIYVLLSLLRSIGMNFFHATAFSLYVGSFHLHQAVRIVVFAKTSLCVHLASLQHYLRKVIYVLCARYPRYSNVIPRHLLLLLSILASSLCWTLCIYFRWTMSLPCKRSLWLPVVANFAQPCIRELPAGLLRLRENIVNLQ